MSGSIWDPVINALYSFTLCWESPLVVFPAYAIPLAMRGGILRLRPIAMLCGVGLVVHLVWGLILGWLPYDGGWIDALVRSEWALPSALYGAVLTRVTGSRSVLASTIVAGAICALYGLGYWAYETAYWADKGRPTGWGLMPTPPIELLPRAVLWHMIVGLTLYRWSRSHRQADSAYASCSRCGYALSGLTNPAACPECGAQFGVVGNKGEAL